MTPRRPVPWINRTSVLLLLLLCQVVACGPDRDSEDAALAADSVSVPKDGAAVEAAGRALRIPLPADPATLNPLVPRPARSLDFSALLYPSLLVARPRGADAPEVYGDLARWWQWDPAKHALTCIVRRGRLWEDTTRVSIADVVRSYEAYRALGWFAPHAAGDSLADAGLASVQAIDDSTVRMTYRADFSFWRALGAATWPILPARKLGDLAPSMLLSNVLGREPLSGGPFRVSDWRSGLNLWLAPHPFAGQNRRSSFDRVEFDVCPGIDARILRVDMGRADLVLDVPVDRLVSLLPASSPAQLQRGGIESVEMLLWNLRSPSSRPEIREAVSLAIDRERIVRSLLTWRDQICGAPAAGFLEPGGPGADSLESDPILEPAVPPGGVCGAAGAPDTTMGAPDTTTGRADTLAAPSMEAPLPDTAAGRPDSAASPSEPPLPSAPTRYAPLPRFDCAAAAARLNAAGWSERDADGFRVRDGQRLRVELMYDRSNAFRERLATLLESDLARVGIELVVQPMDSDLLYARLRSGLFDCILTGFRPPAFPDPSSLWTTHGYWNGTGYSSVVVDSLCATIRREEDAGRLRRHVRRLESLLRRSGPVTFLVSRDWVALIGPQVQGFSGRADDPLRGLEQVQPRDRASRSSR